MNPDIGAFLALVEVCSTTGRGVSESQRRNESSAIRSEQEMGSTQQLRGSGMRGVLRQAAACLGSIVLVAGAAFGQNSASEYQLKAMYLSKIPNFVQWPAGLAVAKEAAFRLCVFGDYSFGASLAVETGAVTVATRRVEVKWVRKEADLKSCQLIFVSRSEEKRYAKILEGLKGTPTLTVGESGQFLDAGGIMALSFDGKAVQFEVNLVAAHQAGIKVDARLLGLAKRVVREKEGAGS